MSHLSAQSTWVVPTAADIWLLGQDLLENGNERERSIRIRCSFVSLLTCVPRSTRDSYCGNSRLFVGRLTVDFLFFAYHVAVDITLISLECRHVLVSVVSRMLRMRLVLSC